MPAMTPRHSATIYQFPAGGVRALDAWKAQKDPQPSVQASPIILDNCWYHQEALLEPKPQ